MKPDGTISAVFSRSDDKVTPAEQLEKSFAAVQELATGRAGR